MTEEDQKKYGTFQTAQMLNQLRPIVDEAIVKRDVRMAKDLLKQVEYLSMKLSPHERLIDKLNVKIEDGDTQENKFACVLLPFDCQYDELEIQFYNTTNSTWASSMGKVGKLGNVLELCLQNGINTLELVAKDKSGNRIYINNKLITINV